MVTVVLYAAVAIALAAAAGYGVLSIFEATNTLSKGRENEARLEVVTTVLRNSLRAAAGNNVVLAPMGDNSGPYTTVPSFIGVPATTVEGRDFIYCPFATTALSGGGTATVTHPGGSYSVQTISQAWSGSQSYVEESAQTVAANNGYLAYVIAPLSGNDPSCSAVTLSGSGLLQVSGGIVRGIPAPYAEAQRATAASAAITLYVGADNGSDADTLGQTAGNPVSFGTAISTWSSQRPRVMRLLLTGTGTPTAVGAGADISPDGGDPVADWLNWQKSRILFSGGTLTMPGSGNRVSLPADLYVDGVTLSGAGTLQIQNGMQARLASVTASSAILDVEGDAEIVGTGTTQFDRVLVSAGRLRVAPEATLTVGGDPTEPAIQIAPGATMIVEGVLTFGDTSTDVGIEVLPGGVLIVDGTVGSPTLSPTLNTTSGGIAIQLQAGAQLFMANNVEMSLTNDDTAIEDNGAAGIFGGNGAATFTMNGGTCYSNPASGSGVDLTASTADIGTVANWVPDLGTLSVPAAQFDFNFAGTVNEDEFWDARIEGGSYAPSGFCTPVVSYSSLTWDLDRDQVGTSLACLRDTVEGLADVTVGMIRDLHQRQRLTVNRQMENWCQ